MNSLPLVMLKFKDGTYTTALIVCPEKIEPEYKKVTENDKYIIYGNFYSNSLARNEVPLYAVEKEQ